MKWLLIVILLLSGCTMRMKHRWENGFTCRCRGGFYGATCECEPTKIPQCKQPEKKK